MVDLDSLTDEERNSYANLAQSLSSKAREALALHVNGWTKKNDGPWLRTMRHGSMSTSRGGLVRFVHGNTVRALEDKGIVSADRVCGHIVQVVLTPMGEVLAALEFGVDMTPPETTDEIAEGLVSRDYGLSGARSSRASSAASVP